MSNNYEAFLLYYTAFHDWEINMAEFKEMLLAEIGEDGIKEALQIFRTKREERYAAGDKRLLYDVLKVPQ